MNKKIFFLIPKIFFIFTIFEVIDKLLAVQKGIIIGILKKTICL